MAAEHAPDATEYIVHHLTHLNSIGGGKQAGLVDLSVYHLDTLFWSISLGLFAVLLLAWAARKATSGVPTRFQAAIEILVEMVESQSKSIVHGDRSFIAPLALTVFVWIFFMNAMDLLPVDLIPRVWTWLFGVTGHDPHHAFMRVVPTADLNATLGMSMGVLLLCIFYSIKIKGLGGWIHELFTAPFGNHPLLYPFNFAMQMIEFLAKTVSHGIDGRCVGGNLLRRTVVVGRSFRRNDMVNLSHPDHYPASLYFYDADACIYWPGTRNTLSTFSSVSIVTI